MGLAPWITCFWPGLPRLWWRGQASGLFTAAFFAIWLNAAVLDTFLTPFLANPEARAANWAVLAVFWLMCFRRSVRNLSQIYRGDAHYNDELFSRAQSEYLRGQWFEAESLLLRLVRDDPNDPEGRLLLATLYRHTRRPDLARAQLDRLERLPDGACWRWEILQERTLAEKVSSILAAEDAEDATVAGDVIASAPAAEEDSAQENESAPAAPDARGGLSKVA